MMLKRSLFLEIGNAMLETFLRLLETTASAAPTLASSWRREWWRHSWCGRGLLKLSLAVWLQHQPSKWCVFCFRCTSFFGILDGWWRCRCPQKWQCAEERRSAPWEPTPGSTGKMATCVFLCWLVVAAEVLIDNAWSYCCVLKIKWLGFLAGGLLVGW